MKHLLLVLTVAATVPGCTAPSRTGDQSRSPAVANQDRQDMTNGSDPPAGSATENKATPAPKNIQPSPWQPPAEVDPVPPPVEGGETKEPSDPGNG
jgi:hypothetical protein